MASPRQRFLNVMLRGDVSEGLPILEWASWWDLTLENWRAQGLPQGLSGEELFDYLGLDRIYQAWITPVSVRCPSPATHGAPRVHTAEEYEAILPFEPYREYSVDAAVAESSLQGEREAKGVCFLTLHGPFGHTRDLLGIEPHLVAFYDRPALLHRMIQHLTDFTVNVLENLDDRFWPDFITFFEDMSYNHGPMISRETFEEFLAPFYQRIVPDLKERGTIALIDSDGQVEPMIPWFQKLGLDGILPLERQAGVDINRIRRNHPQWLMLGGFDKMVMHRGEAAIRREFQRIKPAVLGGRYVPGVDHQTPPEVTLEDYRLYLRLLKEFSEEVAAESRTA